MRSIIKRNTNLFKALIVFFLLLGRSNSTVAQISYSDFLTEDDIVRKAEKGLYLWNEYLRSDLDSLKIMSIELLLDAANKKNEFAKAVGNGSLGSYLIRVEDVQLGINHLNQAKRFYEVTQNQTLLSEILNELGHGSMLVGDNQKAINTYLYSLKAGKNATDETDSFNAKLGLGKAYCAIGDTALGVITISQYKNESLRLKKFEAAADAYAFLGQIEMERNNNGLAKEYYEKSIFFSNKSISKIHLSHALNNKAILHFNLGELDSTLFYFKKSLRIRKGLRNTKGVCESLYNIGSYYFEIQDLKMAELFFDQSRDLARGNRFVIDEKDALTELAMIYEKLNEVNKMNKTKIRLARLDAEIVETSSMNNQIILQTDSLVAATMMRSKHPSTKRINVNYIYIILLTCLMLLALVFIKYKTK